MKPGYFRTFYHDKLYYQDEEGNIVEYIGPPSDYDVQKAAKYCWMHWEKTANKYDICKNIWCHPKEIHPNDPPWIRRFFVRDEETGHVFCEYQFCFLSNLAELMVWGEGV